MYSDYRAINQTPGVTAGLGPQPPETATTVRVEDARTLTTDGPFVAVKEALGGYFIFEADDLDAAILDQVFRDERVRVLASLSGAGGAPDLRRA